MLSASELANMNATVAASLDVSITVQRRTPTNDGYGHTTESYATVGTPLCNVVKPSDSTLRLFADVIGSQRALVLRFMPVSDIRQWDQILYNSKTWVVQEILNAESYTFANECLITTIA